MKPRLDQLLGIVW